MKAGAVKTLFVLNGNPTYDAAADLDFGTLLKSVPAVIRFGYYNDETSALAGTHLAATHYLESWGDARTANGAVVPVQPMIMPLFNGLMEVELLARLAGETSPEAYEQVYTTCAAATRKRLINSCTTAWSRTRPITRSPRLPLTCSVSPPRWPESRRRLSSPRGTSRCAMRPTTRWTNGRFANNGWLPRNARIP